MSAYRYLIFVLGVILTAVLGSFLYTIVNPIEQQMSQFSTTTESATGVEWFGQFMDIFPMVLLLLLMFMLIYGIVLRRRGVRL